MPFMVGRAPIRRTMEYLNAGRLVLKDTIQIFSMNYNSYGEHHFGAKDFAFWHIPQIQHKNPSVQIMTYINMTPSPFVRVFYSNGKEMLIDVDNKKRDEILEHLIKVIGKSTSELADLAVFQDKKDNPANFGIGCNNGCMCDFEGQLPCPGVVPLPHYMRGKFRFAKD